MTSKQETYHKSLVRGIHLSRRYKEYYSDNKDEYRELLKESFGVQSSKELSIDQLIVFVDYMNFKDVKLPLHVARDDEFGITCTKAQLSMMRGLWNSFARTKTDEKLLVFINRQTQKDYTELHMVTKLEAQKIIPALQIMKSSTTVL